MRKTVLTIIAIAFALSGLAQAQSECDTLYIKAMQANAPAERAKLLKDFLASCSGKGSQYEGFANAFLCTGQFPKTDQEALSYGEKALALGGLDETIKSEVIMTLAAVFNKTGNVEKTKTYAQQLIQVGTEGKAKQPEGAGWNKLIGIGHFLLGQAKQKSNDVAGALESYQSAYGLLNDTAILVEVKKMGKGFMDAKKYAEAEKVYRYLAGTGKDPDSIRIVADILAQTGRKGEALQMFKDMYAKKKTGDMANNIGILLAQESKTNPAVIPEAVNYLLEASLLLQNQGQAQKSPQPGRRPLHEPGQGMEQPGQGDPGEPEADRRLDQDDQHEVRRQERRGADVGRAARVPQDQRGPGQGKEARRGHPGPAEGDHGPARDPARPGQAEGRREIGLREINSEARRARAVSLGRKS